jgi:hypothetical protein
LPLSACLHVSALLASAFLPFPACLSLWPCHCQPQPSSCPPASMNDCLHTWPACLLLLPASALWLEWFGLPLLTLAS